MPGIHDSPSFAATFGQVVGGGKPHPWQADLGEESICRDRLIRIPTGFGKTLGILGAWAFNRLVRDDDTWPRRLVWCLPMRVLVEQTESVVVDVLRRLGVLWGDDGRGNVVGQREPADHAGKVGVHLLMGGADAGNWHLHPEHPAVLIGTQDMLLSRALNRGYASPRARWPMEFGLLNHDALWVMDEVQLMDVGLATSAQLQAFRAEDAAKGLRPCHTWWMSATLQSDWLGKSPETAARAQTLESERLSISPQNRRGPLWDDVSKSKSLEICADAKAVAKIAARLHQKHRAEGITLVVMNTVDRAVAVAKSLRDAGVAVDIQLIHSRFRPSERQAWAAFLNKTACAPGTDRIIVATQVVEAGVDISARVLVTELAPWPNLVQRFGRSARWGGTADIVIADLGLAGKKSLPYDDAALEAARAALGFCPALAPADLEGFETAHPELLSSLYPYEPKHLLLRREIEELFDTSPDLSGADVDISRFIRSGDERDVQLFWADIPDHEEPAETIRAHRTALCSAPFLQVADWLCGDGKRTSLAKGMRAWVWDWLDGRWLRFERRDCWPGQTILVDAACGGYSPSAGWSPDSTDPVAVIATPIVPETAADETQDDESLSASAWRTIATHGSEVGAEAQSVAGALAPALTSLLGLAGRWHDAGKAHPAFQGSMRDEDRPDRQDLAKAPQNAWLKGKALYPMPDGRRPGFRHELASTLALFAVLRRHRPDHPALLGPWTDLLAAIGRTVEPLGFVQPPIGLEQEIIELSAADFDLLAYLVCSHHGKVRMTWHACPADQQSGDDRLRIRGIRDRDVLPELPLTTGSGAIQVLPACTLDLAPAALGLDARFGRGWTERVLGLLHIHGPFRLAWLEACLRAADMRASRLRSPDPVLKAHV